LLPARRLLRPPYLLLVRTGQGRAEPRALRPLLGCRASEPALHCTALQKVSTTFEEELRLSSRESVRDTHAAPASVCPCVHAGPGIRFEPERGLDWRTDGDASAWAKAISACLNSSANPEHVYWNGRFSKQTNKHTHTLRRLL
jgi:hypothetical protein